MGHEVLFDNRRGRIGFAESHCDYGRYIKEREQVLLASQAQEGGEEVSSQREAQENGGGTENAVDATTAESDLGASGWTRR